MDIERIYNQYFRIIYGYLLSLCRNPHLAEELAQETFLKALTRKQPENEENDNTIAWLYTIARNLYFQHYNKSRRRQDILKNNTSGQIADRRFFRSGRSARNWMKAQRLVRSQSANRDTGVFGDSAAG